jgi:NAD(P)H dehydrogenase (quinone)
MTVFAVTGSTGVVGGLVARGLAERDVPQLLVVRDPSRAPQLPGATVARAEYADTAAVTAALQGVEVVFMVSAAENEHRLDEHRSFVDGAVAAGVRHVVYTSFSAAAPDALFTLGRDHWATEQYLRGSGLTWTFLRDNLYSDFLPKLADPQGVIRGPAGDGRLAAVAQADVADMALAVLADPAEHRDTAYGLTGPESIGLAEAARMITELTGVATRYEPETVEEAYASRAVYGAPQWQLDAWVSTYTAIASGVLAPVSTDIPRVLGRPARSLRDVLTAR